MMRCHRLRRKLDRDDVLIRKVLRDQLAPLLAASFYANPKGDDALNF